jgi:hypothetical protein
MLSNMTHPERSIIMISGSILDGKFANAQCQISVALIFRNSFSRKLTEIEIVLASGLGKKLSSFVLTYCPREYVQEKSIYISGIRDDSSRILETLAFYSPLLDFAQTEKVYVANRKDARRVLGKVVPRMLSALNCESLLHDISVWMDDVFNGTVKSRDPSPRRATESSPSRRGERNGLFNNLFSGKNDDQLDVVRIVHGSPRS